VRELENLIERILVLSSHSTLGLNDLPENICQNLSLDSEPIDHESDLDLKTQIRNLEAVLIERALKQCEGNRSEAARRLKISYPSLLSKIKMYGLE
jgi:transcriptional regulator with PAS, ATPase and Fis domain